MRDSSIYLDMGLILCYSLGFQIYIITPNLQNCKFLLFSFTSRHEKALEGITSCAEIRGKGRFDTIIKGLEMEDNYQMQVSFQFGF